ncbi:MAG: folate-binding protein YgfZ [Gammaproteobacteria bacterium]|nr:folate-binding protein YgfZ [Gammaproteobacteria bacterium]
MNPRWNDFLLEAGARIAGDRVEDFGNPSRELQASASGDVIADLSHRGLIRVHGADAAKFLQGQLTNDIHLVDEDRSQLSGYCSPKGRLLALPRVFRRDDAYYLQLPRDLLEVTLARLKKYVLISKVTLEDAGEALIGLGLAGPRAAAILADLVPHVPAGPDSVRRGGDLSILRLPGGRPRFALYGPVAAMEQAWTALAAHAAPVGAGAWDRYDILAGIPDIRPATIDEFIPQTVNLELLDGINFKKGCYTGQEIIARLHYRGSVKRRMYLGRADVEPAPAPGTPLYAAGGDGQAVGHVVSACPAPAGGSELLAVVAVEHSSDNTLYIKDNPEDLVTLSPPEGLPPFA